MAVSKRILRGCLYQSEWSTTRPVKTRAESAVSNWTCCVSHVLAMCQSVCRNQFVGMWIHIPRIDSLIFFASVRRAESEQETLPENPDDCRKVNRYESGDNNVQETSSNGWGTSRHTGYR